MTIFIWTLYLTATLLNIAALRKIRLSRVQFIDGIVLGLTFFITVPMFVVLLYGRLGPEFIPIPDYRPFEDVQTSLVLTFGSAVLSALRLTPIFAVAPLHKAAVPTFASESTSSWRLAYTRRVALLLSGAFLVASVLAFKLSGGAGEVHWGETKDAAVGQSAPFLLIQAVNGFTRLTVFGALGLWIVLQPRFKWRVLGLGATICLISVFTSFNRIAVLFFLYLVMVAFRRRAVVVSIALLALLLFIADYSTTFTYFRSLLQFHGYSPNGFIDAAEDALRLTQLSEQFVDKMNGAFESINITCLNYIVGHTDSLDASPGSFIVRPLTIFIPRGLFPGRPLTFANLLGQKIQGNGALNSTLFGEVYASFPLLWPVALGGVIWLYDWAYRRMARTHPVYGAVGAMVAIAWWRFDASFAAIALAETLLIYAFMQATLPRPQKPSLNKKSLNRELARMVSRNGKWRAL